MRLSPPFILVTIAVALILNLGATPGHSKEDEAGTSKKKKTVEVILKDLTLKVPSDWKQVKPKSSFRLAQFQIAPVEDDTESAELAIFNFGAGGGIDANVKRWINQYQSEGRKVKITSGTSSQGKYVFVELSGTYNKPDGPPIRRKTKPVPNSRTLAVILNIKKESVYFLKLTGSDKTVAAAATSLRVAFGGDSGKEKDLKISD